MKLRGFEKITSFKEVEFPMPERKTKMAAGYDICLPQDVTIKAHTLQMVPTGVKAYMQDDEFLGVHIRSSMAVKKGLALVNNVGIIDADYYGSSNEGHIMIKMSCTAHDAGHSATVAAGDGFAQGIFLPFGITEDDAADGVRDGGFGSTTKK